MTHMSLNLREFNRFELKYLLSIKQANEFKEEISHYLKPDKHGDKTGNYAISSLYYDSPDHKFYWEKLDGIKFRRKLRIRHYETAESLTADSIVFVEIKQRIDRTIQKRHVKMRYEDALELCNERIMPEKYDPKDKPILEEIESMIIQYNLRPTIITSYFRQAFIGTNYDLGLRVTFDTNLRYRETDLELHSKNPGKFMISPDMAIMEIKVNEFIPYWLTGLIGKQNTHLIRASKYCQGLEMASHAARAKYYIF